MGSRRHSPLARPTARRRLCELGAASGLHGPPAMSEPSSAAESHKSRATLGDVARSFLRIGATAFGGPAAHIAIMRSELVVRRGWVSEQELLDLIGGASLLPGPTSTEVALMLALRRKGWAGLLVGGLCFIAPSMLLVLGLSWTYVHYGTSKAGDGLLFGVKPVVVAIIASAIVGLARTAIKNRVLLVVGAAGLASYFLGVTPLLILLAGALVVAVFENRPPWTHHVEGGPGAAAALLGSIVRAAHRAGSQPPRIVRPSLAAVFLEFLKLGSIVFGSGYVLVAYLHRDLVQGHHWLSESQLLATVAIGQLTPGPVFTTATSIGYVIGGLPAGLLATVAIFLPSFVLVAGFMPFLIRARHSSWGGAALDGINVAAVAIMAGVTVQLGRGSLVDWLTLLTGLASLGLLLRWRVNPVWLVLGGGAVGLVHVFA